MRNEKLKVKRIIIGLLLLIGLLLSAQPALAHVAVKPKEVGVGKFQTFTVGVPVEKDVSTTGLRLVIPEGLEHVTPNVKPGWEIEVKKEGEGEEAQVTEIIWTGGTIPAGQRDEFMFSAKVPSSETTLAWKAYQTYEDGEAVAWDASPEVVEEYKKNNASGGHDDANAPKPYSTTEVVNDLAAANATGSESTTVAGEQSTNNLPLLLSIGAIVLAGAAFVMQMRKK